MNSYKIEARYLKGGKITAKALYTVYADTEEEAKTKLLASLKDSSGVPAGCMVEVEVKA